MPSLACSVGIVASCSSCSSLFIAPPSHSASKQLLTTRHKHYQSIVITTTSTKNTRWQSTLLPQSSTCLSKIALRTSKAIHHPSSSWLQRRHQPHANNRCQQRLPDRQRGSYSFMRQQDKRCMLYAPSHVASLHLDKANILINSCRDTLLSTISRGRLMSPRPMPSSVSLQPTSSSSSSTLQDSSWPILLVLSFRATTPSRLCSPQPRPTIHNGWLWVH